MNYLVWEYKEEYGKNPLTDEMRETLSGLPIDEQIDYFEMQQEELEESFSYGESHGERVHRRTDPLRYKMESKSYAPTVHGVIVSEGVIVGWVYKRDGWVFEKAGWVFEKKEVSLLNEKRCTYAASEDDGTGSTDVAIYHKLVFTGKKN